MSKLTKNQKIASEKIEAGKRNGSTRGWAGVVLNRVIKKIK